MKKEKFFKAKILLFCLAAILIVAGAISAAVQSAVIKSGRPYILIFTNGDNKETNSKYRLFGRHQYGYINGNLNDKMGGKKNFHGWESQFGLILDNSNPVVQAEQLNWLYYLLFLKQNRTPGKNPVNVFKAKKGDKKGDYKYNSDNSSFDGIRLDCEDGVDSDVVYKTNELMNNLYGRDENDANANDHLSYAEGFGPMDQYNNRKYFQNSGLNYDDSYYQNTINTIRWYDNNNVPSLKKANSILVTDWNNDQTMDDETNPINPNLTYSQNHDNFYMKLKDLARVIDPNFNFAHFTSETIDDIKKASEIYYKKMYQTDKTDKEYKGIQFSPKNLVSLYSDMLINKDTVPIVFYGDIFEADKNYMSTPSAVAEPIMDILAARSKYVAGGQQRRVVDNGHIITNVRFGKDYYEGKTNKDQYSYSKHSGIVSVISNDKNVDKKNLRIYVGKNHANQKYINMIDTSPNDEWGLTLGDSAFQSKNVMGIEAKTNLNVKKTKTITVDDDGFITIDVKGTEKPFVDGYLSMWVPEGAPDNQNVYVNETDAKQMKSFEKTGYILNSNSALDSHVLFQDFAVNVPNQGYEVDDQRDGKVQPDGVSPDAYEMLSKNSQAIADSGITDVWMAPPYTSPREKEGPLRDDVERFGYGYIMDDRYNLGEKDTPSKYGNVDELIQATEDLHNTDSKITGRSLKLMEDFVPHQIVRGDEKEKTTFDEYSYVNDRQVLQLLAAKVTRDLLVRTSNKNLQYKYGGEYLYEIHSLFPKIFAEPSLSINESIPYNIPIKNWSAKYEDAYSLQFDMLTNDN